MAPDSIPGFLGCAALRGHRDQERVLLLDSSFDSELDPFSTEYTVYELPALALESVVSDWSDLSRGGRLLGKIQASDVTFDESRRQAVSETSIRRFLIG
jgi:hypothetical protein